MGIRFLGVDRVTVVHHSLVLLHGTVGIRSGWLGVAFHINMSDCARVSIPWSCINLDLAAFGGQIRITLKFSLISLPLVES